MSRMPAPIRFALLALAAFGLVIGVGTLDAHADKVHKKFKGKIVISKDTFPSGFKSDGAMIKYLKKARTKKLVKSKKGWWHFEYMAFLKSKLNQKEAVIVFYDVTYRGENPEEVYSEGLRPDDPYTKIIAGYITLPNDFFKADHEYEMQILRGRGTKPLATATFKLEE